jgi:hypothetical protein
MGEVLEFIWCAIAGLFRSRVALQAEILVLRHQLNVLRRRSPKRVVLGNIDRLVFCGLYRSAPAVADALKILQPETVIRWHRWFPSLFAREMTTARRPAKDPRGHSPPYSRDERYQPFVGSATDSRRTAQARDRRRGPRMAKKLKLQQELEHISSRPTGVASLVISCYPSEPDHGRWLRIGGGEEAYGVETHPGTTGAADQQLLLRNEYLVAENRILKVQLQGRLRLSDAERARLGEIGHRLGRKALSEVATAALPDIILAWDRRVVARKFDGSRAH